mmetsp:Transcript_37270/g.111606  ORF Transcript_37270/g.111606 Transcript_37270/m.111606 type:complete len:205 (-) Transcript_37270:2806-3420(-)
MKKRRTRRKARARRRAVATVVAAGTSEGMEVVAETMAVQQVVIWEELLEVGILAAVAELVDMPTMLMMVALKGTKTATRVVAPAATWTGAMGSPQIPFHQMPLLSLKECRRILSVGPPAKAEATAPIARTTSPRPMLARSSSRRTPSWVRISPASTAPMCFRGCAAGPVAAPARTVSVGRGPLRRERRGPPRAALAASPWPRRL